MMTALYGMPAPIRESMFSVPPTVTKSPHAPHILLAEDNPVNQRLAVLMLEKWGHTVVVANNGTEVLAALDREPFSLVLMDVQMPELDGFATTAAIRQREESTSTHVPIVALTAHALKGDRERCLAAGMDAYLTKPLQARPLFEVIQQLIPTAIVSREEAPPNEPEEPARGATVLNREWLLARVQGDHELLQEVIELFFRETPAMQDAIREAIARGDGMALERAAHSVKGAASSFGAHAAREAALALERIGGGGDLTDAARAWDTLASEMARLTRALVEFSTEQGR
jgi:two-component system, sensor histidine kinase and response regulator